MSDSKVISLDKPVADDPLQVLLREGARQLLANAVEAELADFLAEHNDRMADKPTVVRNGYLPERTIQTGLGDVAVKIPKTRDRSGAGLKFNSTLIPEVFKVVVIIRLKFKQLVELFPKLAFLDLMSPHQPAYNF